MLNVFCQVQQDLQVLLLLQNQKELLDLELKKQNLTDNHLQMLNVILQVVLELLLLKETLKEHMLNIHKQLMT